MNFAFRGGSVTGMAVAGLALLELVGFYAAFGGNVLDMVGLLFGASLMSLFARVGGGIYTKGADVGADLVGKVEAGIPEDDPRNPAVIADNVGDNVGDCAGMAADLFETYVVTAVSAMLLAYLIRTVASAFPNAILYPLLVCAWAIVATLVGAMFVRMRPGGTIMGALYQGLGATTVVGLVGLYLLDYELMGGSLGIFVATAIGLIVMILIVVITDYYTSSELLPGPANRRVRPGRRRPDRHHGPLRRARVGLDPRDRHRRRDARPRTRPSDGRAIRRGPVDRLRSSASTASDSPRRACSRSPG